MGINYGIEDLKAFCCLARVGQYSMAADELCITASALSRRISKLEDEIGGRLFDRTTRRVMLTSLGSTLYERLLPAVHHLDACLVEAAGIAQGQAGRLHVSSVASVGYSIIPNVLSQFYVRHPRVYLSIRDGNATMATKLVEEREVEFGVTTPVSFGPAIEAERVIRYGYNVVYSPESDIRPCPGISWIDLADFPVVGLNPLSSTRLQIDGVLNTNGIPLPWTIEVDQLGTLLGLVKSGRFVAVMPGLIDLEGYGLRSAPIGDPYIGRDVYIVRRRDTHLSPQGKYLLALIRTALRRTGMATAEEPGC